MRRRKRRSRRGFFKRIFGSKNRTAYSQYYSVPVDPRKKTFNLKREFHNLPRETKRLILSLVILAVASILFLSLINMAGPAGGHINRYAALAFGIGRWYIPILLFIIGFLLLKPSKDDLKGLMFLGGIFFILTLNAFIHLVAFSDRLWEGAADGMGGGFAGLVLSYPVRQFLGFWGGVAVLACLLGISFFLFFNSMFHKSKSKDESRRAWLGKLFARKPRPVQPNIVMPEPEPEPEPEFESKEIPLDEEAEEEEEESAESEMPQSAPVTPAAGQRPARVIAMPVDLLTGQQQKPMSGDIENNQEIIRKTLENFNIKVEMGEVNVGPTVTQFAIKPEEGVKLSKIVSLSDNLALALAAHPIRIEAPIPGKSLVGIEVPNKSSAIVPLRTIVDSKEYRARKSNLYIALGKDVKGTPWLADLQKMPHLLIAGSTNSGKSVAINSIIITLLFQNGPDDLQFIMVDPKRVELPMYNGIAHLKTPVITDVKKTVTALNWAITEMNRRFDYLSQVQKRDIQSYNREAETKMPYIVIVIDELADLMVAASAQIEPLIIRLAQMARAVGIHLILATQRPSVDVITGLIKANINSRIAFSVASAVDSRTILDSSGAEKLLGRGDMLFVSAELSKPKRLQGAFTSDDEIKRIIEHIKKEGGEPEYDSSVVDRQTGPVMGSGGSDHDEDEELVLQARQVIMEAGKASASLLQRRLKLGYARAARVLDALEKQGVIGPGDGAKPREILIREVPGSDDGAEDIEVDAK